MDKYVPIRDVYAREILDSRGNPTIEVEILAGENTIGRASVPSGASTGKYEAVELRDGEARYMGKGVEHAVDHVNAKIAPEIVGINVLDQRELDRVLLKLDGSRNKGKLGANAILGVSMAAARAAAEVSERPLYTYLGGVQARRLPVPMMNIMNGGRHADNTIDIQEFMILPVGALDFREGVRMCAEIYQSLKALLGQHGYNTAVGDEGGFAPDLPDAKEALKMLVDACKMAGYQPGKDMMLALDVAASELYDEKLKAYVFDGESRMHGQKIIRTADQMIEYYEELLAEFPIFSIEDPLDEEDWDGWVKMTAQLGRKVYLVGDDLFVTNTERLQKGIELGAANAILVKINQIGTLSEAFDAIEMAHRAGYQAIISHRSGETADTMIADIAVAFNTGLIKSGAPCRSERVEKYNRLMRIEEMLGDTADFPCYMDTPVLK